MKEKVKQVKKYILPIVAFTLGALVVSLYFLWQISEQKGRMQLEIAVVSQEVKKQVEDQLRGTLPESVSNEQIQWYNAGRASWVQEMQDAIRALDNEGRLDAFVFRVDVDGVDFFMKIEKQEEKVNE